MQNTESEIDYDELINKNLRGVVVDALKFAEAEGLLGENHFYITFRTDFAGVKMPESLKEQYPKEITIVLQHQFSDLRVKNDKFSVVLMFGGIPYELTVPFASVTYFADPCAKFGLSFKPDTESEEDDDTEKLAKLEDEIRQSPNSHPAEVISIDSFRKK